MAEGGRPLIELYDLLLLDLDGVVYAGPHAVPGAVEALTRAVTAGVPRMYVTNNASRPPEVVAAHLSELLSDEGPEVAAAEVVTSAQAAASWLAGHRPGGEILVIGALGLRHALRAEGLVPVDDLGPDTVAVVQGFGPDVGWRDLALATRAVRSGLTWVATNLDETVPTEHGRAPGNGLLVGAVARAAGRDPDVVVGKPGPDLFATAVRRSGAERPLVIGDRLDTDIAGARAAGHDSLLVMTGVSGVDDLLRAHPAERPDFIGRDLSALHQAHPPVRREAGRVRCGGAHASIAADRVTWQTDPDGSLDGLDVIRAITAAVWWAADDGHPVSTSERDRVVAALRAPTSTPTPAPTPATTPGPATAADR